MEFRILGPLEVVADEGALVLGGKKQRALLAALLLDANRPVSPRRLIEILWGETPPATAEKALQVYISQLRKLIGKERLVTQPAGYAVLAAPDELDLSEFHRLRAAGKPREALRLWRGPPLAELGDQQFGEIERARLEELRLACLEERFELDLADGRHVAVVAEVETLVREHPLRERLRELYALALYRSGRQADALAAYQDARAMLVDELGIEPQKSLRDLHLAILRQDPALDAIERRVLRESPRGIFVGRDDELRQLAGALDDASSGHGRLFLILGEPGIGKSRIVDEVIRHAHGRGFRVLVGRCWEASGAPAYWPWVQALRGYIRDAGPEGVRRHIGGGADHLAQILPELGTVLLKTPDPAPLDPESARFQLFDSTTQLLRSLSDERPILLFLDDLHAADTPSLLLLQFLARELSSSRLLVVAACRNVDPLPGRDFAALLAETTRELVTTRLHLGGLSAGAVAEYVELAAADLATPDLIGALYEQTEGNPLFLAETVRLLSVEGRVAIPQSVSDVIARRLAHLSDECNRVLVLASVLGREFSLDALARLSSLPDDTLLEHLDEAMTARVVSDIPGSIGRLRFAHVLIRDTLYESLTTARRVRLHRLAVSMLVQLYGDEPGPHLAELAHHAIAGSDFTLAVSCARRAGDRALALLAYEEAARLYETALDAHALADPDDERTRCELLLALGDADARAGNSAPAKGAFLEAAEIARRAGLRRELARAAAGYGGRTVWSRTGTDTELVPLLEEGLDALGDDDPVLRARLLSRLAGALRDDPDRRRRDTVSRSAIEIARSSGDARALAYALDGRVSAILAPDTLDECLATADELVATANRIGDIERALNGTMDTFIVRVLLGEIETAKGNLERIAPRARALRQAVQLWHLAAARAAVALAEGAFGEAEELIEQAFVIGERAQPEMARPVHRLQRLGLHDLRGTLEELDVDLEELVRLFPRRPVFRCALAYVDARTGDESAAEQTLAELARTDFDAIPFDMEWLLAMSFLVEAWVIVRSPEIGRQMYDLLQPWAHLNVSDHPEGIRGSVARYLGLLATALDRSDDAAAHFARALNANREMGFRPWHARTCEDFARMLRNSDGTVDETLTHDLEAAADEIKRQLSDSPPRSTASPGAA